MKTETHHDQKKRGKLEKNKKNTDITETTKKQMEN